jgi:hypothetical protein
VYLENKLLFKPYHVCTVCEKILTLQRGVPMYVCMYVAVSVSVIGTGDRGFESTPGGQLFGINTVQCCCL